MADNVSTVLNWVSRPADEGDGTDSADGLPQNSDGSVTLEQGDIIDLRNPCSDLAEMVVLIRAYSSPSDLNYRMAITHGTISQDGIKSEEVQTETITFRLTTEATLRGEYSDPQWSWRGPVLGESGSEISPPTPSFDGKNVTIPIRAYGHLEVTGSVAYTEYTAVVPTIIEGNANDDGSRKEDEILATAMAIWDGGVSELGIQSIEIDCRGEVNPDDDEYTCWFRDVEVDPCTGEILSDDQNEMDCDEMEFTECSERIEE